MCKTIIKYNKLTKWV